jgi:glucokinase
MLARIPVHIILEPKTALIGAAAYGISMGNQKD